MIQNKMSLAGLCHVIFLQALVKFTEASGCTEDQVQSCKDAASSDNISESPGGGVCQPKSYVHFTHLCTVTNYVPSINHCCCAQAEQVFCCRYHYDWNYFRCVQADDTIHTRTSNAWPQEILLTVILVPTVSGLCCIICCIRCLCCHGEDEEERTCCCSKGVSKCMSRDTSHQLMPDREVEVPLRFTDSKTDKQYPSRDVYLPQTQADTLYPSVPPAPPVDSNIHSNHTGRYPFETSDHITPNSRILVHYVVLEADPKLLQDLNLVNKSTVTLIQPPINPQVDINRYPQVQIKQISDCCQDINRGAVVEMVSQNYGQCSDLPQEPPPAYDGLQQNDETSSTPVHTSEARSSQASYI